MQNILNRTQLAESLRELAEAGSPVDLSVAESSDVEINQIGEAMLFDLPHGGTGYLLDLEFINQTSKTIYGSQPGPLRMPWEDPLFEWLPDPRENHRRFRYLRKKDNGRREWVDAVSTRTIFLAARNSNIRARTSSITSSSDGLFYLPAVL
ncbi:MAG: hypothetical protein ACRD20_14685 [Terriglobales bacterium]